MKIRADLHVNGGSRKLVLVPNENEKFEHLALKLAAYVLFWDDDLTVDASAKHPALLGQEHRPDLMGTDVTGAVGLWVECGHTTLNKISKVLKRFPYARVAVLKENLAQAKRFREEIEGEVPVDRVELLYWQAGGFQAWVGLVDEKTEVVGDATRSSMNLVVNDQVYMADLQKL